MQTKPSYSVAIVGAGPAGFYAARDLVKGGAHVVLLNRDIRPGGLAEYGIYPGKMNLKNGLRTQFKQILANPQVSYFGNVSVGNAGDLTLADLSQKFGFQAVLVSVGAQGNRELGLPGEHLEGVFYAKDLVFHYNQMPPYTQMTYPIGRRVAIIGGGNVTLDIIHYLADHNLADEVTAIIRRGPEEIRFGQEELEEVVAYLDLDAFRAEIARITPILEQVYQTSERMIQSVEEASGFAKPRASELRFLLRFLSSPLRVLGDADNRVVGLEIGENLLRLENGEPIAIGTGITKVLDVDTVIISIGARVEGQLGLPSENGGFVLNPTPRFPIEGESYEACEGRGFCSLENVFLAGWARKANKGVVGVARKDGANASRALLKYLSVLPKIDNTDLLLETLGTHLNTLDHDVVTKTDLDRLTAAENTLAQKYGVDFYKLGSDEEMLQVIRG